MNKYMNFQNLILFLVFACNLQAATTENILVDPDALDPNKIIYLEQNWTEKDRQYFYFTDQGSRFMDYEIFSNLEYGDTKTLFRSPENMLRYGYIPVPASKINPYGSQSDSLYKKDRSVLPVVPATHSKLNMVESLYA